MEKIIVMLVMVTGLVNSSCTTTLKSSASSGKPSVTRVGLEDTCPEGSLTWERPTGSQLVQFFTKGQASFTVCLWSNTSTGVVLYQLSGSSKKLLVPEGQDPVERFCVLSKCNHVSLLLEAASSSASREVSSSIDYQYKHNLDERCPRCTDSCMQNIFCNSDLVFIGSVNSTTSSTTVGGGKRYHYSDVVIISNIAMLKTPPIPADIGTSRDTPIKVPGERVGVVSTCRLHAGQNYVFAGDMRPGHMTDQNGYVADEYGNVADQLMVGCAQRDVDYALYFISKKLNCYSSDV